MRPTRHLKPAVFAGFLVAAFVWYWSSLSVAFYGDDTSFISASLVIQKASLLDFLAATQDRPVTSGLLWLNWRVAGDWPAAFRAVTLALHAGVAFLLFELLSLLSRRHLKEKNAVAVPLALAFLYLVHPVHNQAIQVVAERGVILAAFFALLSIYRFLLYLETNKKSDYAISCGAVVLAVLSKGFAMTVTPILALYVAIFHRKRLATLGRESIPFLIAMLYPVLIYCVLNFQPQEYSVPWPQYLLVEQRVLWTYLRLLIAPLHLRHSYDVGVGFTQWTLAVILANVAVLAGALALLRKPGTRLIGFGLLAAVVAFAPESSFFPLRYPIWEYRTYFPFCFLFIAALAPATVVFRWARAPGIVLTVLVAVGSLLLDCERAEEMRTNERFVMNTLKYTRHDFLFNVQVLSSLLNGLLPSIKADASRLIAEANPNDVQLKLFAEAFEYQALGPGGHRDNAKLEHIAAVLLDPAVFVYPYVRGSLDTFLARSTAELVHGPKLLFKLYDLLIPQLLRYDPRAGYDYRMDALVDGSIHTLTALRDYFAQLRRTRPLDTAEQARELWVLAVLEVYFGQTTPQLAGHFEKFVHEHPEGARTSRMYAWYRAMTARK